jgi:uncharacterized integral membrane protein
MSGFTLVALVLLAVVTMFALANPSPILIRFLTWQYQTTVALAVIGGAVLGGLLVFVSSVVGQQQLRGRLRDAQARVRELEARVHNLTSPQPDEKP